MSEQLVIEPGKFARLGSALSGILAVAALPRLRDELNDDSGALAYTVHGHLNERGFPALEVAVHGKVKLSCQRCLGAVEHEVAARRTLVFQPGADEFAPMADEDETEDVLPEVQRLDLRELIEEEVLLTLPMSPRHPEGGCEANAMPGADQRQGGTDESPFAILGRLKGRPAAR